MTSPQPRRLADLVREAPTPRPDAAPSRAAWVKLAVLAALVFAMNYWQFAKLVEAWMHDPNWSHGFIIPLFSLYLVYSRRDELLSAPRRSCWWGLPILIGAIIGQVLCVFPLKNDWSYQLVMLVVMFGAVLLVAGPTVAKLAWLPIFYLAFAFPISPSLYEAIAYPLQELAAKTAIALLSLFGVKIASMGGVAMDITSFTGQHHSLTVAEACSGVRSLMAYLALSAAMAYLKDRPVWHRVVFVLSAVPIALACNVLRVLITCEMFVIDKAQLGQDFMHEFTGILMLIPALGMLLLVGWALDSLYVEEDETDDASGTGAETATNT